jgi:hypothetical protein
MKLRAGLAGLAAGAAGTSALNLVTYLDMALRGRPASDLPAQAAGRFAEKAGINLGVDAVGDNRRSALGALLGYGTGLAVGAGYGAAVRGRPASVALAGLGLAAAAMIASDAPMTALGLTDPRTWKAADWLSDAIPHLTYGLVTAGVYRALTQSSPSPSRCRAEQACSALRRMRLSR